MTADEPQDSDARSQAPPTTAGPMPPRRTQTIWPTVIGVIGIVFGSLAILQGCFGAASPLFLGAFASIAPQEQEALFQGMEDLMPWMIIGAVLAMALGTLLLVAGIGLVRRRAWSRKACMMWAGVKMVLVVANSILGYMVQQAQFEAMQDMIAQGPNMPTAMPGMLGSMMQVFGTFTVVLGVLWGWTLPVFVLIWFSRGKIKDEVSGWSGTQSDSI